jgi:hypothetical protein
MELAIKPDVEQAPTKTQRETVAKTRDRVIAAGGEVKEPIDEECRAPLPRANMGGAQSSIRGALFDRASIAPEKGASIRSMRATALE